jgi:hypothetical protein
MGPMKTVKIQGGIGNQLFGLAFAHSLAALSGDLVALDIAGYGADPYGRRFLLADLARRLGLEITRRPLLANRLVGAVMRRLPIPGHHAEGGASLAALARRQGYFDGYWQDAVWIARPDEVRDAVRRFIAEKAGARVAPPAEIVLHFRTYKEETRPDRRAGPDAAWVRRALEFVDGGLGPGAPATLVSDDPALALARLGDLGRPVLMHKGTDPWTDLATLMEAKALILTNSSFSWWGGFCSEARAIAYPARRGFHHYPGPHPRFTVL